MIDTGASKSVIGKKLLDKLGIEGMTVSGDNQMTGIHPGEVEVAFARIETIAFGKLKFNVPIETINQYGLLANMLLNSTVSQSERQHQ